MPLGNAALTNDVKSDTGQSYQYSNGDSQDTFIKNNAFDKSSGYGFTNFLNPVGGVINGVRGKAAYGRQRAEYEQYLREYNTQMQERQAQNFQTAQDQQASEANRKQGVDLSSLDTAFASGDRQKARQSQYDASMGASLATINKRSTDENRSNALNLARRGVLGGSEDASQQAKVQAQTQGDITDATTQAQARQTSLNQADVDQYHALRASILSGNPEEAQQTLAQAQGLTTQAEQNNQLYDFGAAQNQLNGQNANNISSAIGQAGNGLASYYSTQTQVNQRANSDAYRGD